MRALEPLCTGRRGSFVVVVAFLVFGVVGCLLLLVCFVWWFCQLDPLFQFHGKSASFLCMLFWHARLAWCGSTLGAITLLDCQRASDPSQPGSKTK